MNKRKSVSIFNYVVLISIFTLAFLALIQILISPRNRNSVSPEENNLAQTEPFGILTVEEVSTLSDSNVNWQLDSANYGRSLDFSAGNDLRKSLFDRQLPVENDKFTIYKAGAEYIVTYDDDSALYTAIRLLTTSGVITDEITTIRK